MGYNITKITKEISVQEGLGSLKPTILSNFSVGDHYSNTYLAEKLQILYNKLGIDIKAKATDIRKWFETKSLMLQDKSQNKRVNGLKLIKLL